MNAREEFTRTLLDVYASEDTSTEGKLEILESLKTALGELPACPRLSYVIAEKFDLLPKVAAAFDPRRLVELAVVHSSDPNVRHALLVQASAADAYFAKLLNL